MGAKRITRGELSNVLATVRHRQPVHTADVARALDKSSTWARSRLLRLAANGSVTRDAQRLWRTQDTIAPPAPLPVGFIPATAPSLVDAELVTLTDDQLAQLRETQAAPIHEGALRLFLHAINNDRTDGWDLKGPLALHAQAAGLIARTEEKHRVWKLTDAGRTWLNAHEPAFDPGFRPHQTYDPDAIRAALALPLWEEGTGKTQLSPEAADRYRKSHDCPNCNGRGKITITSGVQEPDKYPHDIPCPRCHPEPPQYWFTSAEPPEDTAVAAQAQRLMDDYRAAHPEIAAQWAGEPLLKPTDSPGLYVQRFGRALRPTPKATGGRVNYYLAPVEHPRRHETQGPYTAECEDLIAALQLTFDEACIFKAIWRSAAARLGNGKPGANSVYDAEKMVHYAGHVLTTRRREEAE